jgi:uncharacterized protein with PIN domain
MKHLRLTFEDQEFERLKKAKGKVTWHDFVLKLSPSLCSECGEELHLKKVFEDNSKVSFDMRCAKCGSFYWSGMTLPE